MNSGIKKKVSKGSKIGVICIFVLAAAAGYIVSPLLFLTASPPVQDFPELILNITQKPLPDGSGKYSFGVGSDWAGTESVSFLLYATEDTLSPVLTDGAGDFCGVEPVEGGVYYVRAEVPELGIRSKLYSVRGFDVAVDESADIGTLGIWVNSVRAVSNNVYSLSVMADSLQKLPADGYGFVMYKSADDSNFIPMNLRCQDGVFQSVSVEKGMKYYVRFEMDDNSAASAYFLIDGLVWNEPAPVQMRERISKQEVQNLINEKKSLVNNSDFTKTAEISISNADETSKTWKTLHNFIQQKFVWNSVVVDSVEYSKDNRVNMIYLTVIYE